MRDRNEWFKEVERAYSNIELKTVNRPYEIPVEADVVEGEDILWALGLQPRLNTSDWLVIDLDEVSELVELIRPVPVTGATSDGYHTFDELYHHRAVLFSVIVATFPGRSWKSLHHHDGTMYDGMFIVGIDTPAGPPPTTTTSSLTGTCSRVSEQGESTCDECSRKLQISYKWLNEQFDEERLICPYCECSISDPWEYDDEEDEKRLVWRLCQRRRDGGRLHRGHQVLPVLRRGALSEREL